MSSYDQFGDDSAQNYGTDANFQANYRLTTAFVDAHKAAFLSNNRIWIGGYNLYQPDDSDYDALLTSEGIVHSINNAGLSGSFMGQRLGPRSHGGAVPGQY